MDKIFLLIIVSVLILFNLININQNKEKYKRGDLDSWRIVSFHIYDRANENWDCKKRTIYLAYLMIKKMVYFNVCYGLYDFKYAHVWIEMNGEILDPSLYLSEKPYLKLFEIKIRNDNKITFLINLMVKQLERGEL